MSSLRGTVVRLRESASASLDAAHDHFTFTTSLWAKRLAEAEYGRRSMAEVNVATGSRLTDETTDSFVAAAINSYLPSAAVQQFVSSTEIFLADLVRSWVTAHPCQVDVQAIVAAADRDAILEPLIDQYVIAMAYKAPREWFKQLNAVVNLGGPDERLIDLFAELKATRDVLVHNRGFANTTYVRKAGPLARAADGQPIDLPPDYVSRSLLHCRMLVDDVAAAAAARA